MFKNIIIALAASIITGIVVIKNADAITFFIYEKLDQLDSKEQGNINEFGI